MPEVTDTALAAATDAIIGKVQAAVHIIPKPLALFQDVNTEFVRAESIVVIREIAPLVTDAPHMLTDTISVDSVLAAVIAAVQIPAGILLVFHTTGTVW